MTLVGTANVLLVEDSPSDVRLFEEALRAHGSQVKLHVVGDGEAALAYVRRQHPFEGEPTPELIILDLNLPKKDGREVLSVLKQEPHLRRIPVVVLTTSSAQADVLEAYDLHANCYVRKPVDLDDFIRAVQACEAFWLGVVRLPNQD